jgi:predicted O-methyltransferase YrrM
MVGYGILRQEGDGPEARIGLTPLGETLISDRPGSMRRLLMTLVGGEHYAAWGDLEHAIQAGRTAFDIHFGTDVWSWYRQNPAAGEEFNRTMVSATAAVNDAVMAAYDFRPFRHLVDVGGGHGSLLRLALEQNTSARGTLFDQPSVVQEAREVLAAAGLAERVELVGGSFFESVPGGGDAYLLKYILHDWDDARCEQILKNVREAIDSGGTLLIFDTVIPAPGVPDFSLLMDLNMLVMTGGRERSEPELRQLLSRTGFELKRVIPTQSHVSITEAKPA